MNLFRVIRPKFMIQLFCAIFTSILGFSGPFFLYRIVNHVQHPEPSLKYGMLLLLGMFLASITKAIIDGQVSNKALILDVFLGP
jgi:hypothetical protein